MGLVCPDDSKKTEVQSNILTVEVVTDLVASNFKDKDIALIFGCSRETIIRFRKKNDIQRQRGGGRKGTGPAARLNEEDKDCVKEYIGKGMNNKEIAEHFSCSEEVVRSFRKNLNIDKEIEDQLRDLISCDDSATVYTLVQATGYSLRCIEKKLRKMGVDYIIERTSPKTGKIYTGSNSAELIVLHNRDVGVHSHERLDTSPIEYYYEGEKKKKYW